MKYDIVIPSWNMAGMAVKCLKSIQQHSHDYRVIFVDNGSEPGEFEQVLEQLETMPHLLIANATNLGFVKATNQGIKASEAPYVVLMNNDTEAVPGWLEKLRQPIDENSDVQMSGPLTTTPDSWQGKYPKGKKGYVLRESGMLAFFCTMFTRGLFENVGLLDERFGVGFGDDDDYCDRVLKAGYKMALVQDLVIPHHHRSTFKKIYAETDIKAMQNRAYDVLREKQSGLTGLSGKTDVVYILGNGSKWGNNEIRYSIRSFRKHFRDIRNVVIVGELPAFAQHVVHIPHPDTPAVNKDCRMAQKILAACNDERVSENFILCTDDTLLLADISTEDFTGWHNGPILYDAEKDSLDHKGTADNISGWFEFVYNTGRELKKRGLPDNNYDRAHCPQPINKAEFIEVMSGWDMINKHYTVSNIYNNSSKIFKGQNITGRSVKIYKDMEMAEIGEATAGKICLNYNDMGLGFNLKSWLQERFPVSSPYERFITATDRRSAAEKWFADGADYGAGTAMFAHFCPKNQRLIRWFEVKKDHPVAARKLRKTIELWLR